MIPRIQWEVFVGEEVDGHAVGWALTFEAARRMAEERVRATGATYSIVRVTREVVGVVQMPEVERR